MPMCRVPDRSISTAESCLQGEAADICEHVRAARLARRGVVVVVVVWCHGWCGARQVEFEVCCGDRLLKRGDRIWFVHCTIPSPA